MESNHPYLTHFLEAFDAWDEHDCFSCQVCQAGRECLELTNLAEEMFKTRDRIKALSNGKASH